MCGDQAIPKKSICEACAEAPAVPLLTLSARVAKAEAQLQILSEIWCAEAAVQRQCELGRVVPSGPRQPNAALEKQRVTTRRCCR